MLFKDRRTPISCLCPCMLHTHTQKTGSRAIAGGCRTDERVFPPCGAQTITIFTLKFNQVAQNLHRAHFLWLFVLKVLHCLPSSLVPKSADVVSGTVSGKKESSGKWSCFCIWFEVLQENSALEVKEALQNFLMMFWFSYWLFYPFRTIVINPQFRPGTVYTSAMTLSYLNFNVSLFFASISSSGACDISTYTCVNEAKRNADSM